MVTFILEYSTGFGFYISTTCSGIMNTGEPSGLLDMENPKSSLPTMAKPGSLAHAFNN
jgi:hypothetical protein